MIIIQKEFDTTHKKTRRYKAIDKGGSKHIKKKHTHKYTHTNTHTELKPHSHPQSFELIPGRRHDGDRLVVSGIDHYQTYPSLI